MNARNMFNGKSYGISIVPVHKSVSIPNPNPRIGGEFMMPFNNIYLEAAIFNEGGFFKPFLLIELNHVCGERITEDDFRKFIFHIMANEQIDDPVNFEGMCDIFSKYGFFAQSHEIWQLFYLRKIKMIFIFKDPRS